MSRNDCGKYVHRVNMPLYIPFVDLKKSFDNANWTKLFNILKLINIDFKDKRIVHKLYLNRKTILIRKASNKGCGSGF